MHVLPLSKALVTIKTDYELPVGLEQLTALYTDLELNQFLKRIQQSPVVNETSLTTPEAIETSYELVTTPERLTFWIDQCRQAKIFALDTETTSLVARHAKLVGVSLSCMAGQACYIPVGHVEGKQLDMTSVLFALSDLFADRDLTMVGHNLKYDLTILETVGLLPQCRLADTMLMSYVLDAAAGRHDMDSLAKRLLVVETTSYEDVCGTGAKQIRFDEVALEPASHYA